ncbi:hypothetical protein GCM10009808_25730 [Microbacterium sediminicola]|uniref:Glutaminase n=1 Tax=Microbacterium sediminicola TaxID=415210 RepID=A0ABP4UJ49_9MICO
MSELARLLDETRTALAGTPRELLGEVVTPRLLGIARSPSVRLCGEAWRLGVLLLSEDAVFATGEVVRSREPARRGYTAESQRERAGLAEAAFRGGILPGVPVHLGWRRLDLAAVESGADAKPLALIDGVPQVRWSPSAGYVALATYLTERAELLRDPPLGAT